MFDDDQQLDIEKHSKRETSFTWRRRRRYAAPSGQTMNIWLHVVVIAPIVDVLVVEAHIASCVLVHSCG